MASHGGQGASKRCAELEEFVADYLEGRLPAPAQQRLGAHVDECPACRAFLASYRSTVQVAKHALRRSSDRAEAPEALVQAILRSLSR